ncbi:MAG: response regulator [Desulfofustis sp.]|nr:response regulator [Desulfofustis sp.]
MRVLVALLLVVTPAVAALSAQAGGTKKTVLYINSYHNGYPWSDTILDGIRAELGKSVYSIDLQIEYMDAKKYNIEPVVSELLALYREKFANEHFDVILVSDDDAFIFALKYRDQLFAGVPIVFCGVNDLGANDLEGGNITGVVENFDLAGTIDVALKLHPNKRRMIVVGDNSTAGHAIRQQIEEAVPAYFDRLSVDYWVQLDLDEVQRRVQVLPDDTFLFFIPYYQVIGSRFYSAEEMMAAIHTHSRVPMYTAWEFLLGNGAVGGKLLSGFAHGRQAAAMALRILAGERAAAIPVRFEPTGEFIFDYNTMEQMRIDEKMLPEGSRIINEPNLFYELSRELFWTIMVSFLLLVITVVFLAINMIARRRVEQKMKEQLTFQEILIDTIPQLVSWKDAKGRYVGANRTFAKFFGLTDVAEVVNKTTRDVVRDETYVDWSVSADAAVVSGKEAFRKVRRKITDAQSQVSWLEVNKVPLRDQNGRISGTLTTAENVTRERNLEKQLLQSQKMEAIGTMAGGIAHDFNNILTSIINSTELAIGDVPAASQTAKDLERVLKAARRGGRVVKQILAFSRPSQEDSRPTDCGAVISEVVNLMEVSLPGNIVINARIAADVGAVQADPTQIHQAVMNLCTTAFHALREGGGEITISLEKTVLQEEEATYLNLVAGDYLRLTVADNGPGIEPEIIDKIFDPFFSMKDKSEGTGLGLTVVHGIVKGHGGGLRVQSEVGRGTSFDIFLPDRGLAGVIDAAVTTVRQERGGTILFVEDDPDQLHTAPRLLRACGFQVQAVGDSGSAAALIAAEPSRFDLLITDYDMPGLNGLELINLIGTWAPALPVIMVSGREEAVAEAVGLPAVKKVFVKPYDIVELTTAINTILQ